MVPALPRPRRTALLGESGGASDGGGTETTVDGDLDPSEEEEKEEEEGVGA
jgi:hypothetical protein